MKVWTFTLLGMLTLGTAQVWANGVSQSYTHCMNNSYGKISQSQKCIKTEQKAQTKRLKKHYKAYVKRSAGNASNIQQQHQLWENRVKQRCYLSTQSDFAALQRAQCVLLQTAERADYYQGQFIGIK